VGKWVGRVLVYTLQHSPLRHDDEQVPFPHDLAPGYPLLLAMSPFLHFPSKYLISLAVIHLAMSRPSTRAVRVVSDAGRGITVNRPGSRGGSVIFEFLTMLLLLMWLRVLQDPSQAQPKALGKQEDMELYDAECGVVFLKR
jgi:hypothetical protein